MVRKDRQVTDKSKINEIISSCDYCRLGLIDGASVYIVPLSFGFVETDGEYTFYFHSAETGHKIDLIKKNPVAGLEMDTNYQLVKGKQACYYSAKFQSIVGNGKVTLVEDQDEKKQGLIELMKHTAGKDDFKFSPSMIERVCVFKLVTDKLSCKEHI